MSSQPENMPGPAQNQESGHCVAACPGCDLLLLVPAVPNGHYLACGRCGTVITKSCRNSVDRVLALSLTGLFLYFPAILLPLLTLTSIGFTESGNVLESCSNFIRNGYYLVALMVFCTAVIFPFLKLFLPFSIALSLKLNRHPAWLRHGFKLVRRLDEWGMVEVYLLGILVTLIKMEDMAQISYEPGFFCFIALVLLSLATTVCLDEDQFWYRIDHTTDPALAGKLAFIEAALTRRPGRVLTGAQAGMVRCSDCGRLIPLEPDTPAGGSACPRCLTRVRLRRPGSLTMTWALVATSLILFIPANTLPIMQVDFLGIPDRSTILDGILYFFNEGSFGIGLIILTASILVPLFKILGLLIILFTVRSGRARFLKEKTRMFHFIEFIGRWSMLDIFVIALLTVMVNFGFFTTIHTAPAATYFCTVVICTMAAAIVFDPRIMWDRCAENAPTE